MPVGVNPGAGRAHLEKLAARLADPALVYPCLRDLLENGPIGTRPTPVDGRRPSRHDILHFVCKWALSVGLSQEACVEWLTPYSVEVLKAISTSGLSAIRHNVKGVAKYIYGVEYPFNCGKEQNPIRCRCDPQCPVYHKPEVPPRTPAELWAAEQARLAAAGLLPPVRYEVKKQYRQEYEKAVAIIQEMRAAGETLHKIVERLNAEKLPTITGRKWNISKVSLAIKRARGSPWTKRPPEG